MCGFALVAALLVGSSTAQAVQCVGNLLSNASFEQHTGSNNSIGDPIPSVWVLESGEDGATTHVNPPDGSYVGYVWGISSTKPGRMTQKVNVVAGVTYDFTFYSGTHTPVRQSDDRDPLLQRLQHGDRNACDPHHHDRHRGHRVPRRTVRLVRDRAGGRLVSQGHLPRSVEHEGGSER